MCHPFFFYRTLMKEPTDSSFKFLIMYNQNPPGSKTLPFLIAIMAEKVFFIFLGLIVHVYMWSLENYRCLLYYYNV